MLRKKSVYTRSQCVIGLIISLISIFIMAPWFLYSGAERKMLFFNTHMRMSVGESIFFIIFGFCSILAGAWDFVTNIKAIRYMDIHNVNSVSKNDLKQWKEKDE